jgi:PKD repeat protein
MKNKLIRLHLIALLAVSYVLPAQQIEYPVCGTEAPDTKWEAWFQAKLAEYKNAHATEKIQSTYTIPVIVHVIHASSESSGAGSNLKAAQVIAQIDALNDVMAGNAPGVANLPSVFAQVRAGDLGIHFCLATKDLNGNAISEPGIDRIDWGAKGWTDPSTLGSGVTTYFNQTIKPNSIWDPSKYFNIWVADFLSSSGGGLIGYATFPAGAGLTGLTTTGTASTDGVVMASRCFGCKAKFAGGYYSRDAYAYGITTVHEVGHWLGLRHISGDASCGDDYCNDTPPQTGGNNGCANGLNWGCPSYPFQANQCSDPNGEMFMNFMDYSDDPCRSMYSVDQSTRIFTALNNGTYRKPLLTANVCKSGPSAIFTANFTTVCPGTTIDFTDQSASAPGSWRWTFAGGSPATSTVQNPSVTYNTAGTYNVKLVVTNANGSDSTTKTAYITVASIQSLPLAEGFQSAAFPPANWDVKNIHNDTIFWKRSPAVGGYGTSTSCMLFDDYNQDALGARDEIITPRYDFSALSTASLTFDIAYARYNAQYSDSLAVLVSSDCGKTFSEVYVKGGTALATAPDQTASIFIPGNTQWRTETVNLTPFVGHSAVTVSFQNRGHNGQSLYVDNINISGTSVATGMTLNRDAVFSVYPNPSEGLFELNTGEARSDWKVDITTVVGKLILSEYQSGHSIKTYDLRAWGAGLYFITLSQEGRTVTKKVVVR